MVGMLSVCYRFEFGIVGMLSVTIPALCKWSVFNRCHVGYLLVSNRAFQYRILPEMTPIWTRLVLRCLQQHCRWPTAGRFIEIFAGFVGFVSVWLVWLGYNNVWTRPEYCIFQISLCYITNIPAHTSRQQSTLWEGERGCNWRVFLWWSIASLYLISFSLSFDYE